jgi:hypothetical protein
MPRGAKIDRTATAEAHFLDNRSFRGQDGHDYLKGDDIRVRRLAVYERAKALCEGCPIAHRVLWQYGHMHHKKGGLVGRCDCLHNLAWVCPEFHRAQHVQVRWTKTTQEA